MFLCAREHKADLPYSFPGSILSSNEGEGGAELDDCLLIITGSKTSDAWRA